MVQTIIYSLGLIMMLIHSIKYRKIMGILLCALYLLISIFSIIALSKGFLSDYNIRFLPYLFMLIAYITFFYPFINKRNIFSIRKLNIKVNRTYVFFAAVYCLCGLITLKVFLPSVIRLMASGNWYANRVLFVNGELTYPYNNFLEYFSINFCKYFQSLAFIISFSLIREQRFVPLAYGTLVSGVIYTTLLSIYTSARGNFFILFIIIGAVAFFYLNDLSKRKKLFIIFIGICAIAAIVPFILEVTASRFSLTNNGTASIYQYMGQAPIVFNRDVFYISKYSWGVHGLGKLFGDNSFSQAAVGGTWGTGFYTFVGYFFIDWGPIGTIIIGIVLSAIISRVIRKDIYQICDVYLIFEYFILLSQGVFVIGTSYVFDIVAQLIIYLILKYILDRNTFVFKKIFEPNLINFDSK